MSKKTTDRKSEKPAVKKQPIELEDGEMETVSGGPRIAHNTDAVKNKGPEGLIPSIETSRGD